MDDLASPTAVERLAHLAVDCMIARQNVSIAHPENWIKPPCWPLPAVKGRLLCTYRPLAILDYCEYALAQEHSARGLV